MNESANEWMAPSGEQRRAMTFARFRKRKVSGLVHKLNVFQMLFTSENTFNVR